MISDKLFGKKSSTKAEVQPRDDGEGTVLTEEERSLNDSFRTQ